MITNFYEKQALKETKKIHSQRSRYTIKVKIYYNSSFLGGQLNANWCGGPGGCMIILARSFFSKIFYGTHVWNRDIMISFGTQISSCTTIITPVKLVRLNLFVEVPDWSALSTLLFIHM